MPTGTTEPKPGYKTTEFWLMVVADLAGLATLSGAFETGSTWGKVIGLGVTILASLGYTAARTKVKANGQ
jgi:hypothetical protein